MEPTKIAVYRARAEKCARQAELTSDANSKLHLLAMAKGWLILADNLAKKDVHDHIDQAA